MKNLLKSSTQEPIIFGPVVLTSDHITGATGLTLTLTVTISKNGGSYAAPSGTVSEVGNGFYQIAGNATDTNTLGSLLVHATGTAADVFDERFEVVAFNPQDAVHLGLTALPNTACTTNASLITSGTGTDQLSVAAGVAKANKVQALGNAITTTTNGIEDVNTKNINNVSASGVTTIEPVLGTAYEVAADSSGRVLLQPTQTGVTIPTVTNVGTLATYTGNTPQTGDAYNYLTTNLGLLGANLTALPAMVWAILTSALTTSGSVGAAFVANWASILGRLTSARAGYLDNLNIGGAVASQSSVNAINTSSSRAMILQTVGQFGPGESYTIQMDVFNITTGSHVNADSTPTLTATGAISGSLAVGAATNPATGIYRWTYANPSSPTLEQIRFDGSETTNTLTYTLSAYSQTVDSPTAQFTSTDKSNLTAIYNKLPPNSMADATNVASEISASTAAIEAATLSTNVTEINGISTNGVTAIESVIGTAANPAMTGTIFWALNSSGNAIANEADLQTILTQTNKMQFDGSSYIKSDPQTLANSGDLNATQKASVTAAVPTAAQNAAANRDVDNRTPAANSLGADVNAAVTAATSAASAASAAQTEAATASAQATSANAIVGNTTYGNQQIFENLPSSSGDGVDTVTITVTDSATPTPNPLQNAVVQFNINASKYTATTNSDGVCTLSPDEGAATYLVSIKCGGYQFSQTSLIVTGTMSQPYAMSQTSITPSDPGKVTAYITQEDLAPNVEFLCQYGGFPTSGAGIAFNEPPVSATTNSEGVAQFTNRVIGATYQVCKVRSDSTHGSWEQFVAADTSGNGSFTQQLPYCSG